MKTFYLIAIVILMASCNSTQLMDYWKNPDIEVFETSKILIVGITPNNSARKLFEKRLVSEYNSRDIEAVMSIDLFKKSFTTSEQSESDLLEIEEKLLNQGFDAVLITKIIGSEDREAYYKSFNDELKMNNSFKDDIFESQHIYQNKEYYELYKVYNAETSLYCICSERTRDLIWKGYIDIIDPKSVKKTTDDYVKQIMFVLEDLQLINKKISDFQL